MLFNKPSLLGNSVFVLPQHDVLAEIGHEVTSPLMSALHSIYSPTLWLAVSGIVITWISYILFPSIPSILAKAFAWPYRVLMNKYGFDSFNDFVIVRGAKGFGKLFYRVGDQKLIDGLVVNGSGSIVRWFSGKGRLIQDGYLYHYITVMVIGLLVFLWWLILG